MLYIDFKDPDQIRNLVDSLSLDAKERFDLNRRMANRARQYFRQQIRAQRDVHGLPYTPRRLRRNHEWNVTNIHRRVGGERNMLTGMSRSLKTRVDNYGFIVGLAGVMGMIGREHNEGTTISITTRMNAVFNSRTGRWEGGRKKKFGNYELPKRTFIEWNDTLQNELLGMIGQAITNKLSETK